MAESVAKQVYAWIRQRPFLVYALKKDLVNFSSLAREIQKELAIKNFDAVIVAVRRFQRDIRVLEHSGKEIVNLLRKSRLEIRTGINDYIVRNADRKDVKSAKYLHLITGSSVTNIITDEELDADWVRVHKGVVEVKIISPPEIEMTPGVIAYLSSAFAERGINLIETYSCYTDTIFIVEKKDLTAVVEILEKMGIR